MYPPGERRFLAMNIITIICLFALILAGGIVRSSGSGMGCPDWPKCFGSYIPPTNASQLPEGYKEKYVAQRVAKNQRFAKTLDLFGFAGLGERLRQDQSILEPEEFNVSKTWTEYINRLVGALTGLFLLGCAVTSTVYFRKRKRVFFLSVLNLVLVVFQAWLGSVVVSTNLLAWVVTVHMLAAIAIIAISIYTYFQARMLRDRHLLSSRVAGALKNLALAALVLTVIQIGLGTEVREQVDAVANAMNHFNRTEWVQMVGTQFNWHRDLAIFVLLVNAMLFVMVRNRYPLTGQQFRFASYVAVILVFQILTGIVLAYLALPAIAQAVHVFLATLLFGSQFYLLLLMKPNKSYIRRSK